MLKAMAINEKALIQVKASKNCAGGVPEGKPYPNQSALCSAADQGRGSRYLSLPLPTR